MSTSGLFRKGMAFFEYDGMVLEKLIISQKAGIAELIVVLSDEKMRFDRQGPRLTPAGATNMRNLAVSVVQTLEVVKFNYEKKRINCRRFTNSVRKGKDNFIPENGRKRMGRRNEEGGLRSFV